MPETGDIIAMALNAAEGSALERGEIPSYGMWADFVLESLKRAGYAVVKLTDAADLHRHGITVGVGSPYCETPKCCPPRVVDESADASYSAEEARQKAADLLAAALLAAAAAEREANHG